MCPATGSIGSCSPRKRIGRPRVEQHPVASQHRGLCPRSPRAWRPYARLERGQAPSRSSPPEVGFAAGVDGSVPVTVGQPPPPTRHSRRRAAATSGCPPWRSSHQARTADVPAAFGRRPRRVDRRDVRRTGASPRRTPPARATGAVRRRRSEQAAQQDRHQGRRSVLQARGPPRTRSRPGGPAGPTIARRAAVTVAAAARAARRGRDQRRGHDDHPAAAAGRPGAWPSMARQCQPRCG